MCLALRRAFQRNRNILAALSTAALSPADGGLPISAHAARKEGRACDVLEI
jgi:hypothetical protein